MLSRSKAVLEIIDTGMGIAPDELPKIFEVYYSTKKGGSGLGLPTTRRIVREISGIFDASAVGYEQALVAFRLAADKLGAAGVEVAAHPGVSHCYGRTGRYNLWFTLAVSPSSPLGFRRTVGRLAERTGAEQHMLLPMRKRYKLAVGFGDSIAGQGETMVPEPAPARQGGGEPAPAPTDEQRRAIRALQVDLPRRADPFTPLALQAGIDPDMLLVHGADFLAAGWKRR